MYLCCTPAGLERMKNVDEEFVRTLNKVEDLEES
jgi:hypothetical protein